MATGGGIKSVQRKRKTSNLNRDRRAQTSMSAQGPSQTHIVDPQTAAITSEARAKPPQGQSRRLRGPGPPPQPLPLQFPPGTPKKFEPTRTTSLTKPPTTTTTGQLPLRKPGGGKPDIRGEDVLTPPGRRLSNQHTPQFRPKHLKHTQTSVDLNATKPETPHQEPTPLPRIPFLDSKELTAELLHGHLSLDNIVQLSARIRKLAKGHNLSTENVGFLQQSEDEDSDHQEDDETTLTPESVQDEDHGRASPSPTSIFTYEPSGGDHVDFRASYVSLASDALITPTPPPPAEAPPNTASGPSKSKPRLRTKRTIGQLGDALGDLEQIETALKEAIKIQSSADTIVQNLEAEMYARIFAGEALLKQKGLAEAGPSTSPKSGPTPPPQQQASNLHVPANTGPLQTTKQPSPNFSSGGKHPLKDSERKEQLIKHIRNEKSLGELRWEAANQRGAAKLWLPASLSQASLVDSE